MEAHFHNSIKDGSDKPQHHHAHHHSHHPPAAPLPSTHYSTFYPEMVVQPATESIDLTSSAEYDKERQIIEKCLSKLSLPIVSTVFCLLQVEIISWFFSDSRRRKSKCISKNTTSTFNFTNVITIRIFDRFY